MNIPRGGDSHESFFCHQAILEADKQKAIEEAESDLQKLRANAGRASLTSPDEEDVDEELQVQLSKFAKTFKL